MRKYIKHIFTIHHWLGLVAGALVLVISLTGAILVFDDEIDHALFKEAFILKAPAKTLSIDASLEKIRAANPEWEIRIPTLPSSPTQALLYELRKGKLRQWITVHPETGEVISVNQKAHYRLTQVMLDLHYNLLSGTTGKIVVFFVGVALLILTATGLILYRRSIVKVITFRQKLSLKNRRAFFSGLHRIIGVWALVFNFILCTTGLTLAIVVIQHSLSSNNKAPATPQVTASVDKVLANISTAYPGFEVTYISVPPSGSGALYFLGRLSSDPLYYGAHYSSIPVDYTTGEMSQPYFLRDQPLPKRLFTILQATHFGDYAGYLVKLLYCIGGLLPGILSITGYLIWHHSKRPTASRLKHTPAPLSL